MHFISEKCLMTTFPFSHLFKLLLKVTYRMLKKLSIRGGKMAPTADSPFKDDATLAKL